MAPPGDALPQPMPFPVIVDRVTQIVAPGASASTPRLALLAIVELRTMTDTIPPWLEATIPVPLLTAVLSLIVTLVVGPKLKRTKPSGLLIMSTWLSMALTA